MDVVIKQGVPNVWTTGQVSGSAERRLIKLFADLAPADQQSLLAFAEFLSQRSASSQNDTPPAKPIQPAKISRPERESVVAAIKRLSKSYHMLERSGMLDQTSSLMSSHVLQGRAASEVIDDLEQLFLEHYQRYLDACSRDS